MATNLWHDVPLGDNVPETFNTIIEIPRGSANKYEVDKETGLIKLDRVLFSSQYYPFDYGFAPQTYWHDNDPLDVMVLSTFPLVPGLLLEVRPIGVLGMIDGGESDDKIIAVPSEDPRYDHIKEIDDIGEHRLKEIENFFQTYKMLQKKEVETTGFRNKAEALKTVEESVKLYTEKFSKE
ncbi:MAG: inorganic pyrophosphatase [Candidatus Kerfeldbacteria bacterium CG15_BIG_FIL_POST_REV_8_21_14_020_45_12]|uniref:Inorganic pyrophosphatase n=1 Tax=Candidatus Kerfeldbacteria bacterium CG15_BIG_FIL_POST_REV_8_21_14_020_45_12 TaxID=2014247 RepID=A0A2M7H2Q7_9BACT|nr:MAG: inorganic pyrophosphatase [Candidatus Kerfeldbacteria bacterium CG15_BIG_FIL_POST_REV_8_21_14_020_45_12]PJA93242.1 MAG: inorganic pyrophosphatase [Candidatus Kerfeldbacteria bacterium CG_4_9_14_3_um_filter_45_8]